jgi:hypothetical protein
MRWQENDAGFGLGTRQMTVNLGLLGFRSAGQGKVHPTSGVINLDHT